MGVERTALRQTLATVTESLLSQRAPGGWWEGRLSSSALATATAVFALSQADAERYRRLIDRGRAYLHQHQNADGGWGDTPRSASNISTTMLAWSALASGAGAGEAARRAEAWLARSAGSCRAGDLAAAVAARYGRDRTFAAPILTMCALAGRGGEPAEAWRHVKALPFELAALPRGAFRHLRLPVVSYALPALIAVGQAQFSRRPSACPVRRLLRAAARRRTLRVLRDVQPPGGGFLEAPPLTSFVAMSLIAAGRRDHPVVADALAFLQRTARRDGSWPIDTHLATWVTTLSVNALAGRDDEPLGRKERRRILHWLLDQQTQSRHRYTQADRGGWAWTPLPGGVPDADDTAGALLAIRRLGGGAAVGEAAAAGVRWLVGLQNADGGVPTFCRGWGRQAFDRSGADLTAHALLAWSAWEQDVAPGLGRSVRSAARRALRYLAGVQRPDGAFEPLWFGNEQAAGEANPTYGTARVAMALAQLARQGSAAAGAMLARAAAWLERAANDDGGWGGDAGVASGIEETALATDALARAAAAGRGEAARCVAGGVRWLVEHTDAGRSMPASPIGLYFARLWYYERLYPLIFTASALRRAGEVLAGPAGGGLE
jgi:squalene-hopene/tetraprenyl-beta-curcumene cyclase